jgi:hypothetical protein
LLTVALGACGRSGDEASISTAPPSLAPAFEAPATTTTVPPAAVQPSGPATTGRAASSAATAPIPSPAAPGSGAATATALTPPAPGTYRYDTTGQSQFGPATLPFPAVTTLVVDRATGTVQHATRDLRDPVSHNGGVLETVLDYRPDGIWLVSLRVTASFLLFTQSQDLRPPAPVLLLPTGFAPGLHRELDLAVPGTDGAAAHLAIDVGGTEQVVVGGQRVATLPVHLVVTIPGAASARLELTAWVSPAYRLWVREHAVAAATSPDGQAVYRSEYDATLQQLAPS